jgi:hypothetical protein
MAVSMAPDQPSPAAPCRLRRLIRPILWKAAARGTIAVLVVSALVVPLVCLGWTMLAIFVAVTVGLNVGLWAGRDSGLAAFAGAMLMPLVGLVIALYFDVQLVGPGAGAIALKDIQQFPYAARFRFTDARVATEFITAADPRRLLGIAVTNAWRIAPIVPTNWTPAEPVGAWAVATVSGVGPLDFRTPRNWQQSNRAAVRFVPTTLSPVHSAIGRAITRYNLSAAPGAPLLYWVEDPVSVISDERTFLAWVMFGGVVTWLFFLVGEALLVPGSLSDDVAGGPPKTMRPEGAAIDA